MQKEQLQEYLEFAKNIAHEAGQVMHQYYRADQKVEEKSDHSPVTVADTIINSMLIERVKNTFPDHGVMGEEESWQSEKPVVWVCDPIDSTVSFIVHIPTFTFALALVVDGEPLVAVVYNPMTDEMYSAIKNVGAFRNNTKIAVSNRMWGDGALLLRKASPLQINILDRSDVATDLYSQGVRLIANHGAVWSGCLIADGSVDGYLYEGDGPHDVAAVKLLVEEAGGKVTDLLGGEQRYNQPIGGSIVSNCHIHANLIDLVGEHANSRD